MKNLENPVKKDPNRWNTQQHNIDLILQSADVPDPFSKL